MDATAQPTALETVTTTEGVIGLVVCILGWGTANVFVKAPSVVRAKLHPCVLIFPPAVATGVIGMLIGAFTGISPYGVLGGALWGPGKIAIVIATAQWTGLGVSQSVTSGSAIISSFVAGLVFLREPIGNLPIKIGCLGLLMAGVAGITAVRVAAARAADDARELESRSDFDEEKPEKGTGERTEPLAGVELEAEPAASSERRKTLLGVSSCLVGGIGIGCSNMPYFYEPAETRSPLRYLAGYAIGQLLAHALVTLPYLALGGSAKGMWSAWAPLAANGALFILGYWGSVVSTAAFGLAVGYPLAQMNLIVAGFWSVFFFQEVRGARLIAAFLTCCLALGVGGAGLKLA
jgi:glucose uptake protein GlcU